MAKYLVQHKIKTLSHLDVGFDGGSNVNEVLNPHMEIDGYKFTHWEFNIHHTWKGDAWFVSKEIESDNASNAINTFRINLAKIIEKIAFISQCYLDFARESFLVYKTENNPSHVFWLRYVKNQPGVPLSFGNEEYESYEKISKFEYSNAFRYLQECNNSIGYMPKLMLLFAALEALSGKVESKNRSGETYFTYSKDTMKEILGSDLFNEIFGKDGLRHKLDHGDYVDFVSGKDYVEEIHSKIIKYFNGKFKTKINEGVIKPQRHFYDNYVFSDFWYMKYRDLNLVDLLRDLEKSKSGEIDGCTMTAFVKNY